MWAIRFIYTWTQFITIVNGGRNEGFWFFMQYEL